MSLSFWKLTHNRSFLFFLGTNITEYLAGDLLSLMNSFLMFLLMYAFSSWSSISDIPYIGWNPGCFPSLRRILWSYSWCLGKASLPSFSLNSFLNSLYLWGIPGVVRFSNTLTLGTDFRLFVEVTVSFRCVGFKVIRWIVFLSTIERCWCVGLELVILS
jgi:hypothetical protein